MSARSLLPPALLCLAAVYLGWYWGRSYAAIAITVMAVPPAVLALLAWRGRTRAAFWAAVLALGWFSHAVMEAWSTPADRGWALAVVALSLAVIATASLPGLRARFGARRGR